MQQNNECQSYLERVAHAAPRIVFCQRMDEKSSLWNYERHSHNGLELIYFLDGMLTVRSDGSCLDASIHNVVLHPPGVMHQEFSCAKAHREVIALWVESDASCSLDRSYLVLDKEGVLCGLFKYIYQESCGKQRYSAEIQQQYLTALLLLLARPSEASPQDTLETAMQYIHMNYAESITLQQLSILVSVSPSYLERLFRTHLGTSPMRYLQKVRMDEARKLLRQTTFSIEEIGTSVGIPDASYFWRLFRKWNHLSPGQYRKQILEERDQQNALR